MPTATHVGDAFAQAIGIRSEMSSAEDEHVTPEAEAPEAEAPLDDVRARLAARGLLRTGPRITADDIVRPERPVIEKPPVEEDEHPREVPEDEWDLEPTLSEVVVPCPQCRRETWMSLDITRFRCTDCSRAWRYAICERCANLHLVVERQESWQCPTKDCGNYNRSWWRMSTARGAAEIVVARRRQQALEVEREEIKAGVKRRRRWIIIAALFGLIVTLAFVLVVRTSEPSERSGTNVVCAHWARVKADIANGSITGPQLENEVEQLQVEADGALPEVTDAVSDLAAALPQGGSELLLARTVLSDACSSIGL